MFAVGALMSLVILTITIVEKFAVGGWLTLMVTAVCGLTHLLLPGMVERGWGRVINVASLAGLVPAPAGHTLYGASKAFLIRFSEALAAEHASRGVQATALCPGFTYSEFHDVTGTRQQMRGLPTAMWMDAGAVAASLRQCAT